MENHEEQNNQLNNLMHSTMDRIREMVDTNTIVGQPITTPDGVTLIPISKVTFGFGGGGGNYGAKDAQKFGGGNGAGAKIDPVAFLIVKDGSARILPVSMPPASTVDRVVEMVPDILDKVEKFFDKKQEKETF